MKKIKRDQFWKNKKVFLTGHTGFKGSWLSIWLHTLEAKVKGYALAPDTTASLFQIAGIAKLIDSDIADINDYPLLLSTMQNYAPEIVFHLAAQPLVRKSYHTPLETYMTNVMGTAHLLEAVRHTPSVKAVVIITTDKCYENKEWIWAYRENEPLGGYDPYSSSKACAELVAASYRNSFINTSKLGLATARAGNVIGGGDFSQDRLIPDFIRAIQHNEVIQLRYPNAIRPWQHVLESLHGYLVLAEKLWQAPQQFSQAWNFGPYNENTKTVAEVVETLIKSFGTGFWQQDQGQHLHEAHYLKLDIQKAATYLDWHPALNINEALEMTAEWYRAWSKDQDMLEFTTKQIQNFSRRVS